MDTDGKDVKGGLSGAATGTVSVTADEQEVDVKIMEDKSVANAVHSFKESVEILSVEVVQSPLDVQHNKDQSDMVNDEADIESKQPTKQNEGSFNENEYDKNSADCVNNMVKQELVCGNTAGGESDALTEVKSGPLDSTSASVDTFKDSLAIDGDNKNSEGSDGAIEIQESVGCQNSNSFTGIVLSEDTSDNVMIQENITISDMQQICQSVEDPNVSDFPARNEMDEVVEISGNVLTSAVILAFEDIQESIDCTNNNSLTGRVPSEDTSDNAMIHEDITISDMQQFPEDVCESVEDPNVSDYPARNEMDEVVEISGNVLTSSDILAFADIQESIDCTNNNSLTGRVPSEDTSDNIMIQENVTISDMQQIPEGVCQSVEDPNSSDFLARNEMEEVTDISGRVLTSADILAFKDIHNKSVDTTLTQDENVEANTTINSITGLSLLAQYGSDTEANDSDNDSVIEVSTSNHDYRNRIVEIDSDSDSDSSSSSSDLEYLNKIRKTIEKRMEVDDDDEEDGDAEHSNAQTGIRKKPKPKVKAKGELNLDDLPPIQDLQITVAEDECIVLGKIHSIVDQLVLVSALPNSMLVDLETVLFLDKGQRVLGQVFDVLGQVADPLYCVRFNSSQQITEKNIQINEVVYMAPKTQYTQYIILSSIMKQKGSDASWENDLEPPPRFLDYSDDEEQQLARRQLRNKDRPVDQDDPQKRARMDAEEPQVSSYSRPYSSQPRQRYPYPTRGSGPPNRGSYGRPHQQYTPQYRNPQIPPTHNPSSWHSNYYPQPYAAMPSPNVPYAGGYPRMPQQTYPQVPVYPMGMPYPPPSLPHARPPNNHPAEHHRFMPNAFNMRLPTIPGHFDTSTPPPSQ